MIRMNHRSLLSHTGALVLALWVAAPLAADEPQPPVEAKLVLWSSLVSCSNSLIGVEAIGVDDVLRSHLRLAEGQGVVVTSVADDSVASKAGIQMNDVLVTVGEQPITGVEGLQSLLQAAVDKVTTLGLIRSGQKQSVEVTPQSQALGLAFALSDELASVSKFWLGVGLASADDTLRSQLGIASGEGLVVTGVEGESPAAKAGVMVNDLLLKLDGKALSTIEALTAQLQEIGAKSAPLELLRRGNPATLTVTPEQRAALISTVELAPFTTDVTFTSPMILSGNRFTVNLLDEESRGLHIGKPEQQPPDLAKQVADLLAQANQLQKSLESLDAALKAQSSPPANPAENK